MSNALKETLIFAGCILTVITAIILRQADNIHTVEGKFYGTLTSIEGETYYQFRSNDDSVWWLLTEKEMGFIPTKGIYRLTYDDKGTTKENKTCGCAPVYECECELYDDEFMGIVAVQ